MTLQKNLGPVQRVLLDSPFEAAPSSTPRCFSPSSSDSSSPSSVAPQGYQRTLEKVATVLPKKCQGLSRHQNFPGCPWQKPASGQVGEDSQQHRRHYESWLLR